VAFRILERLTGESFARRRQRMRDAVTQAEANQWVGFDDSLEDLESRNFGYFYELIAQSAQDGTIDLERLEKVLQNLVVVDWKTFRPLAEHVMANGRTKKNPWGNFQWLAENTEEFLKVRGPSGEPPDPARFDGHEHRRTSRL
jgi:hypothetical protein